MRRTRSSRNTSQGVASANGVSPSKTVWQWKGDEGQWEPYPPSACAQLDSALSSGDATVSLTFGSGAAYDVDLKKMVQVNTVTKYKRKIRSHTLKPESLNGGDAVDLTQQDASPVQIKVEEMEEQPIAKKKRGEGRSQKKSKVMPMDETESKEIVKTVVMKGKAPVDSECKAKAGKAHVYSEGDDVYDVMLNQTNLEFNNNKFFLIQLLQDDSVKAYSVWFRWGRVGKVGQNNLVSCGGDLLQAKEVFKKKFLDKTKNEWAHRTDFEKVAGKYDMVFMDYSTNGKEEPQPLLASLSQKKPSKLDVKVQSLLELICDIKAMEECVLEMKFDTRKAPLGKLTTEQIRAGYSALKKIEECVKRKGSSRELLEACNQFYTRIPHDFGLRTPPIIRSEEELKEKIALLEALSDIFSVDREGEKNGFLSQLHNRTLLWHGSRLSNWVGILSQGLRVAPPEAPVTGYMFGKGIYFADMSSKSANYCFANQRNKTGLLLLSEVALGDSNELLAADYEAAKLPAGKHSTKGLGQTSPDPSNAVTLNGVTVPMGPGMKTGVGAGGGYSLLYNEFIVYNPAQTHMRYLLRVQFNYSSLW